MTKAERNSVETNSPAQQSTKACPICGEQILAVAKKCKHCGEFLTAVGDSKAEGSVRSVFVLALLLLLVGVLAFTNPSDAEHKKVVYDRIRSMVPSEGGFPALALDWSFKIAQESDLVQFDYHNYLVFSTLTRGEEVLSYGVLGKVIVRKAAFE